MPNRYVREDILDSDRVDALLGGNRWVKSGEIIRQEDNPHQPYSPSWLSWKRIANKQRIMHGPGWLYGMERSYDYAVKIGVSAKPESRVVTVRHAGKFSDPPCGRVGLAFKIAVRNMFTAEKKAHSTLAEYRIGRAEWFFIDASYALLTLSRLLIED